MAPIYVGIDLGGTNVRAGMVDDQGQIVGRIAERSSQGQQGYKRTVEAIVSTIREALGAEVRPTAIGLAAPGHVDAQSGIVRWAPNLGETREGRLEVWKDVPLAAEIEARIGAPVFLGNDANLAALGEYYYGSGKGTAAGLVLITVGTGIGGGVVLNGKQLHGMGWQGASLLVGANGGGGELGHAIVLAGGPRCPCGAMGCIEGIIQKVAISARGRQKVVRRGRQGKTLELAGGDLERVTPRTLHEGALAGDPAAIETWDETGYWLGVAIATYINIFNPEIVAVGGQISKAGDLLLEPARRAATDFAIPTLMEACRIVQAERLDDAGVVGAAALARQMKP